MTMDESVLISRLLNGDSYQRLKILQQILTLETSTERDLVANAYQYFNAFSTLLNDINSEVKIKCIEVIQILTSRLDGDLLDECMSLVMKQLMICLTEDSTLQYNVVKTLKSYLARTSSFHLAMQLIIDNGLETRHEKIQRETIRNLPTILRGNESVRDCDLGELIKSLVRKLNDGSRDEQLREVTLKCLKTIQVTIGDPSFEDYMQTMAAPLRKAYQKIANSGQNGGLSSRNNSVQSDYESVPRHYVLSNSNNSTPRRDSSLLFGFIPHSLQQQLEDQENFRTRADAVENLKSLVFDTDINDIEMMRFVHYIEDFLDDSNFKITTVTLEIVAVLVDKLYTNVHAYMTHFIKVLTKRMGDNKIVVRQSIMKIVMQLMQIVSPSSVLSVICDNLGHRNSRTRQETINIVIASLLTYPSVDFDLKGMCQTISPSLVDSKRQVRQAALECFAVLAQAMGAGNLMPLVEAVDSIELSHDGEGVMAAVQARLARRQLPRLNVDGLVDYACPHPTSAKTRGAQQQNQGADMDWILAASSGMGSARSLRSELSQEEMNSARSEPARSNAPRSNRRFHSAGRRKNKLPWQEAAADTVTDDVVAMDGRVEEPDMPPLKPRATWGDDSPRVVRRAARNKHTEPVIAQNHGSYKQLYLNRKQTQSDMSKSMVAAPRRVLPDNGNDTTRSEKGLPLSVASTPGKKKTTDGPLDDWLRPSASQTPKPMLDPIGVTHDSPIPLKATLVRGPSSRRSKVPPINDKARSDLDGESGYSPDTESDRTPTNMQSEREMTTSLKQIRNSASRKRAEKLYERHDSGRSSQHDDWLDNSPSPPRSPPADSETTMGYYSHHNHYEAVDNRPLEALARRHDSSLHDREKDPKTNGLPDSEMLDGALRKRRDSLSEISMNGSGTGTSERRTSLVEIIGRGYNDENDVKSSSVNTVNKVRDRRKMPRAPLASPLGMTSMYHPGAADKEEDGRAQPAYDEMGVVGRGMFDRRSSSGSGGTPSGHNNADGRTGRLNAENHQPFLHGVHGVGLKERSDISVGRLRLEDDDDVDVDDIDDYDSDFSDGDDEDIGSISMSRTLRESMERKKQKNEQTPRQSERERQREIRDQKKAKQLEREKERDEKKRRLDEEKAEKRLQEEEERNQQREDNRRKVEEQRQQEQRERLRQLSAGAEAKRQQGLNTNGTTTTFNRSPTTPKSLTPGGLTPTSPSADLDINAEVRPHPKPEQAINEALKALKDEEWMKKVEGLTLLRRVVIFNPEALNNNLHTIILAMIAEVKNLRSQVSRLAIVTLADMFTNCKRMMEPDVDVLAKVLLGKSGETNGFIRDDVERSLEAMVNGVTPQKALNALVLGGASHRNVAVRRATAQFLYLLVEKMGPGRILSGIKDITDKVLPTAAHFITDGSPETRYYGRKIFHILLTHPDFEKMVAKHVPASHFKSVQDTLETVRTKGPGEKPAEAFSARARRSGQGSRSGSLTRGNSANSDTSGVISLTPQSHNNLAPGSVFTPSNSASGARPQRLHRTDEQTMNEIKLLMTQLAASDWKERHSAIQRLEEMCQTNSSDIITHIIKIFDKFNPRLQDNNSKVNLLALQTMLAITPTLKSSLGPVVNALIQNVAPNLSSKNKDIHNTALDILDSLIQHMDACVLLQPFASQAQCGNPRSKPVMVEKTANLVVKVYPRKPRQVYLHVLPLTWYLLNQCCGSGAVTSGAGNIRSSTEKLVRALYGQMGQALLDTAQSTADVTPRCSQVLISMTSKS